MIAETHITAYINQEKEYFREVNEESYSINSLSNGYFELFFPQMFLLSILFMCQFAKIETVQNVVTT